MFCDKSETEKNHDLIYIIYHITTTKNKQTACSPAAPTVESCPDNKGSQ